MKLFCKHKWILLSSVVTESKFEHTMKICEGNGSSSAKIPWQMCDPDRKHIQTFFCECCGKFKRFVESI